MGTVRTWPAGDRLATTGQSLMAEELEWLHRIRGEYLEMPGLCLTRCQAQRLWGLPCDRCDTLLRALVEERFLIRTTDGRFIRYGGDWR